MTTKTPPTKDRCDYRAMGNRELIEEAKRGTRIAWEELAIALAEKLEAEEFNPSYWNSCPRCGYDD